MTRIFTAFLFAVLLVPIPAAMAGNLPGATDHTAAYVLQGAEGLVQEFAPVFIVEAADKSHNKIGTPAATLTKGGKEEVRVDPAQATVYTQVETFDTDRDHYTNLIYRVHFEKNPFTWVPLNVGAGENVGAIAVITLNSNDEPVWLTTVQSCGCYHAIVPTDYLPEEAYPDDWSSGELDVYGEHLPALLPMKAKAEDNPRIVITIRGDSHRCKDISVQSMESIPEGFEHLEAAAAPMDALKHLPLPNGEETSFYHTKGHRKGLVKGAYKPLETLLFGLWSWDHNVGQDREYGPKRKVGRRFYTTLFFARKKDADMWHYARYLEHNGWKP